MENWKFLGRPKEVPQENKRLCWAAALESWLDATPNRPAYDQDYLVIEGRVKGHVTEAGDLKKKGLLWIAHDYGITWKAFSYHHRMSLEFLLGKLRKNFYIYLGFNQHSAAQIGHAVVVWGADADDDEVYVMDPWEGRGNVTYSFSSFYNEPTEFLVCWRSH